MMTETLSGYRRQLKHVDMCECRARSPGCMNETGQELGNRENICKKFSRLTIRVKREKQPTVRKKAFEPHQQQQTVRARFSTKRIRKESEGVAKSYGRFVRCNVGLRSM